MCMLVKAIMHVLLENFFLRASCLLLTLFTVVIGERGPANLTVNSINQTQVSISWSPVAYYGTKINNYNVKAMPIKWFSTTHVAIEMEWLFSNNTSKAHLLGLQPGTQYNISVEASTQTGETEPTMTILWTEIGEPEVPPPVEIISRDGSTLLVKLTPGKSEKGPITGIQVVVLQKTSIVSFNEAQLYNSSSAEEAGLPFYITAVLRPDQLAQEFTIGDGRIYGGFFNSPLKEDASYEVLEGVMSSLNGITKVSYSPFLFGPVQYPANYNTGEIALDNSGLTTVLAIAVGVFGFLLVLSVLLYFLLRRHYGKRRPSDELVLNDHIIEGEENGCVPGLLHLGADANLGDFWELLKERYPIIPRNMLEISDVVLGRGQFGEVRVGKIHQRGRTISVLVQFVQNHANAVEKERRALYSEMDAQLRLGSHESVADFIGISEEADILHLVGEHYDSTLRGLLLRSRQSSNGMICSLSENVLLNAALRIAEGMKYLTDHGIPHRHLSARSVAIVDGYQPKITNFGLFYYNPSGKKLDFTRWQAPELLKSHCYTPKADVWSFGVLLWEICTLGGTPFADVPTREVYPRVVRGLRLQHVYGASDELYQLMLHCWELDSDERPTFLELCAVLKNMSFCTKEHLRLEHTPGFQFQKFQPSADEL